MSDADLDSILDNALDELDTAEQQQQSHPPQSLSKQSTIHNENLDINGTTSIDSKHDGTSSTATADGKSAEHEFQQLLHELGSTSLNEADLGDQGKINDMLRALMISAAEQPSSNATTSTSSTSSTAMPTSSSSTATTSSTSPQQGQSYNASIEQAIKMIAEGANKDKSSAAGAGGLGSESEMDEMFAKLMKELGDTELGGAAAGAGASGMEGSMDAMIEKLMSSMLSKDVLYPAMKDIEEKFPQWLSDNKSKLPADEYEKYVKQHECLQKICRTFETTPDDMNSIMALMTEMQSYGQPPQELVPLSEQGEGGLFPTNMPGLGALGAGAGADSDENAPDFNDQEMRKMMDETCKTQ